MRRLILALLTVLALGAVAAPMALADSTQESIFQDDQYLVYSSYAKTTETLFILKTLGVNTVRVNVEWITLAPKPNSRTAPKGFNPVSPLAYPAASWAPYDRLVHLADAYGITVQFNLTGPGPLWAMAHTSPTKRAADHWYPNPTQFRDFAYAVAERYSGHYFSFPAVHDWSIWNEPNQPGWLAPQSEKINGHEVAVAPRLYREYVQGAYEALYLSGHVTGGDTILIGETAPEGDETSGFYTPLTPVPFIRDMYCVNARYRPLTGTAATALGCPSSGSRATFVADNPGLFDATGFAHHPYYFFEKPNYSSPDPNYIPLSDIGRLERMLNRIFATYSVDRTLPIYLTEYGYQTRPPDPYQTVTPAEQAEYLNEADYMAWRDPRIKSVAQFLLYDAGPNLQYKPSQFDYWDTFQTGVLYANGTPKPSYYAYRVPIWIPSPSFRRGQSVFVWGQLRPALSGAATAEIQFHPSGGGSWSTLSTITTSNLRHFLTANVTPPGSGYLRIAWAVTPTVTFDSRNAPVTQR